MLGLEDRIAQRLVADKLGCWLWQGWVNDAGYGEATHKGHRHHRVHQITYEQLVGQVPDGLELDHLCRVRKCASPLHLEAVTYQVNWRRGMHANAVIARGAVCSRGHKLDEANTYYRKDKYGIRQCRRCKADWMRKARGLVTAGVWTSQSERV